MFCIAGHLPILSVGQWTFCGVSVFSNNFIKNIKRALLEVHLCFTSSTTCYSKSTLLQVPLHCTVSNNFQCFVEGWPPHRSECARKAININRFTTDGEQRRKKKSIDSTRCSFSWGSGSNKIFLVLYDFTYTAVARRFNFFPILLIK